MKKNIFKKMLVSLLLIALLLQTVSPMSMVQAANITEVKIQDVFEADKEGWQYTKWTQGVGWEIYLDIEGTLQGFDDWQSLYRMKCSVNGGTAENIVIQYLAAEGGLLYFKIADLPQDISGTTLKITGEAVSNDESAGISFGSAGLTLVGTADGWILKKANITEVKIQDVFEADKEGWQYTKWSQGKGWEIYLDIEGTLQGFDDWQSLYRMKCSVNGGTAENIVIQYLAAEGGLLYFKMADLPQDISSTTLTITGEAVSNDETTGISFGSAGLTLVGTADGWSLDAAQYTSATAKAINSATSYGSNQWCFYIELEGELSAWTSYTALSGLKYSINDGESKDLTTCSWQTHAGGTLYFTISEIPKNLTMDTKITVSGKCVSNVSGGTKGIELEEDFVLYGNEAGWALTEYLPTLQYTPATAKAINSATGYGNNQWRFYLELDGELSGWTEYTPLSGFKYSINDGESKDLTGCSWQEHAGGTLYFAISESELPKNLTKNTKVTISGKGKNGGGTAGIELTTDITLYGNQAGWSLVSYLDPVEYTSATAKAINNATGYGNNQWRFYLELDGELSDWTEYTPLSGFEYSVNGGESKDLIGCSWQEHAGGTLYFAISGSEIPEKLTEKTTVTIRGKGKTYDGTAGIELIEEITLYGNDAGWSLTGFLAPVQYTKAAAKSINSATGYNGAKWSFYLKLSGELSAWTEYAPLSGFEYSINDGERKPLANCSWQTHDGGTFYFTIDELANKLTKNTKVTIYGKGKTFNATGIELTKNITLYGNDSGWSLKGFLPPVSYAKATAVGLDGATGYRNGKWGIYVKLEGDLSKVPFEQNLTGFEYSFNDGERKALAECNWQKHLGGMFFFTISEIPENIKMNTKLTIYGKGKTFDGAAGIELTQNIVIYANQYGLALGGYRKAPVYTDILATKINFATSYNEGYGVWHVYLDTDKPLPGAKETSFQGMVLEVNGKKYDIVVTHATHQDTLFFTIDKAWLDVNAATGSKVTLKAGKALHQIEGIGINLLKDVTLYKFYDTLTFEKPTTKTKYTDITFSGMAGATGFNKNANTWYMEFVPHQTIPGEEGTKFYYIDAVLNGKAMQLQGTLQGGKIMIGISESVLPSNTKTATLTLKAGSKAVGGHGEIGIHIKEKLEVYLFNGLWSDEKFDEVKEAELFCTKLIQFQESTSAWFFYFRINSEFPGKAWYNQFILPVELNGKTVDATLYKADSSAGKLLCLGIYENQIGEVKEGYKLTVKAGAVAASGGYKITIMKDFMVVYQNGMWLEYRESDVTAPKAQNLWDVARFEEAYIPTSSDGTVFMTGEDQYNKILSTEKLMDFTISFNAKKIYDDAATPTFYLIMRGNPISEDDPMSKNMLNGYVITFEGYEYTEEANPNSPELWGRRTAYIKIWKNGCNEGLRDQYLIGTYNNLTDNPYFKYDEAYDYEVSVYNISETVACIELKVNGELVYKCYDEAGAEVTDPAINAGTFGIYGIAPAFYGGKTVELTTVLSEATECLVGDSVGVAVTYPSILEGAEFTVDKEGATVTNGNFIATEAGVYTVHATYNGKELKPVTITVKERIADDKTDTTNDAGHIPVVAIILIAVTSAILIIGGVVLAIKTRKRKTIQAKEE